MRAGLDFEETRFMLTGLDDPDLLDLMLADTKAAPDVYKPTKYWANYEKKLLPELKTLGLTDFRRRKNSILASFGATDLRPSSEISLRRTRLINNRIFRRLPFWPKLLSGLELIVNKLLYISGPFGVSAEDIAHLSYWYARQIGVEAGAKLIDELEASLVGSPEDVITVNDKSYTTSLLGYYVNYTYLCKFLDSAH